MSRGGEKPNADTGLVGVNWGSSNFRAWRIDGEGALRDEIALPRGVAGLDRAGMAATMAEVAARWPGEVPVIATGMIGSNVGWQELPYLDCPAGLPDIARALTLVTIGGVALLLAPGLACRRADGRPDILRGEDVEIFGALALGVPAGALLVLPGTHTKWARVADGQLRDFFTSMSGELFDRMTTAGLLASVVEGEATPGDAFAAGVAASREGLGAGTALFGVRAAVIRGELARADAASWLRGLLIGAEFADAARLYPDQIDAPLALIGNAALSRLYASAAPLFGRSATIVEGRAAGVAGFVALAARVPA